MSRQFQIPANLKPDAAVQPEDHQRTLTSQVISLKNAHKAWLVLDFTQAVGHATTPTLNQATSIAAGTNKAGPTVDIWANEDCAATDTLVKQTAGASYAVTNDVKKKQVVFEIDPTRLDVNGGYDCVYSRSPPPRRRPTSSLAPGTCRSATSRRRRRARSSTSSRVIVELKFRGGSTAAPVLPFNRLFPHTGNRIGPRTWHAPNSSPASRRAACFPSSIRR
jgi:hypothetical protein